MLKTSKIISKRIRIKPKSKKAMRKKSGQSHYNANDSGNKRRGKRPWNFLNRKAAKKIFSLTR
jgi:ribosomal protein L35